MVLELPPVTGTPIWSGERIVSVARGKYDIRLDVCGQYNSRADDVPSKHRNIKELLRLQPHSPCVDRYMVVEPPLFEFRQPLLSRPPTQPGYNVDLALEHRVLEVRDAVTSSVRLGVDEGDVFVPRCVFHLEFHDGDFEDGRSSGMVGSSGAMLYMYSSSTVPSTERGCLPGSSATARQISLFKIILHCFCTSSFSIQLVVFKPSRQCNLLRPSIRSSSLECCRSCMPWNSCFFGQKMMV